MSAPSPFTPEQEARIREIVGSAFARQSRVHLRGAVGPGLELEIAKASKAASIAAKASVQGRRPDLAVMVTRDRNGRPCSEWRKSDGNVATRAEVEAFLSPSGQPTRKPSPIRRAFAALRRQFIGNALVDSAPSRDPYADAVHAPASLTGKGEAS